MNAIKKASLLFCLLVFGALQAKDYLGAELYSLDEYKYGRYEFRMKAAVGSGILSTFFLYYNDSWIGNPEPWREIDMEVLGKMDDGFQSNIITGHATEKKTSEEIHNFNVKLADDYHTYMVDWTPDYIAWYFDGREVRRDTGSQVSECQEKLQSHRFNLWISEEPAWAGVFNPEILPVYQYVNWFKYSKYTPKVGPGGSDFTLEWTDNFDKFDTRRWATADWTFDENLVDFSPDNIVTEDGYLILCLTSKAASGHNGAVPKDQDVSNNFWKNSTTQRSGYTLSGNLSSLKFSIPFDQSVQFDIFSIQGKLLGKVDVGNKSAGIHNISVSEYFQKYGALSYVVRMNNGFQKGSAVVIVHGAR